MPITEGPEEGSPIGYWGPPCPRAFLPRAVRAYEYYHKYTAEHGVSAGSRPYLRLPLSDIAFVRQETHLFRLLFMNDMDLDVTEPNDFYSDTAEKMLLNFLSAFIEWEKNDRQTVRFRSCSFCENI